MEHIGFTHGKVKSAIIELLTLGGLGIWYGIDLIVIAIKYKEKDTNNNKENQHNFAIMACILVLALNVCTLIFALKDINDLKFNILNTLNPGFADDNGFTNYNDFIDYMDSNNCMQVFLENDATDQEIKELKEDLEKIEGVKSIIFISKEEAYNTMKEKLNDETMEGIVPDIFSVSYQITITDLSKNNEIYNEIVLLDNIKKVRNDYEILNNFNKINVTVSICIIFPIVLSVFHIVVLALTIFIIKSKGDDCNVL